MAKENEVYKTQARLVLLQAAVTETRLLSFDYSAETITSLKNAEKYLDIADREADAKLGQVSTSP